MSGPAPAGGDASLAGDEGFPPSIPMVSRAKMERWITLSLAGVALAACMLAGARAVTPVVGAGATLENPGGAVLVVQPGGVAWQDGIRAGQTVIELTPADQAGGWRIVTERDDGTLLVSRAAPHERKLRASWPLVVAALTGFALAAAWLRRRPRDSELASAVAVTLAAAPLSIDGSTAAATLVLPAAMVLPAVWLLRWSAAPIPLRYLPLAIAVALTASWLLARAAMPTAFDEVDQARFAVTVVLASVALFSAAVRPSTDVRRWIGDPQVSVVLSLALMIAVGLVLANVVRVPLSVLAILGAIALLAFARLRRLTSKTVDRLFFAEMRARSAAAALEAERGRVAREIHDAPLQELSGVIRKLDLNSEAEHETDALRAVADQLRTIATELYPPVLQDLGLAAALRSVIQRATTEFPDQRITLKATTLAGDGGRAPGEVELAMFRIGQEAINNALNHAHASRIAIQAVISQRLVQVSVEDDGRGIERASARRAQEAGRMGLASMEQRAAAIGAGFERSALKPTGTRIEARWEAS